MDFSSVLEELRRLPHVENVEIECSPDKNTLLLRVAGRALNVRIVTRASGYPRDVREAVWQAGAHLLPHETLLLCIPALPASSRQWLQQEKVAYLDGQGNFFLLAEGIYLFRDITTKPNKQPAPVETHIFRGRASQTLHARLHAPERMWHVTDLAAEAKVAPGTALKVCETLEKMLLMERKGRGPQSLRHVPKPGALLDAWAEQHRLASYTAHRYYRWMSDLDTLARTVGDAIEQQNASYAVTLMLGAIHRVPFVTHTEQAALLLPDHIDLSRLASDCRLKAADEGYNLLLLTTHTDGPLMYSQNQDDLWLASDIQLYLDLHASSGRAREQAIHLRQERIGY